MRRSLFALAFVVVGCGAAAKSKDPKDVAVAKPDGKPIDEPKLCDPALKPTLDEKHAEGRRIVDVCIVGASPETITAVRGALHLRADKTLSAEALRNDLAAAYATGRIDQIEAGARATGDDGAVLWLTLTERPRIASLSFDGLEAAKGDPTLGSFPKPGDPLNRAALRTACEKLRAHYTNSGWDEATVEPVVTDGARVTIKVREGTRAKLGKVTFEGAHGGREVALRKAVELDEGAPYSPDRVERAALLVNAFYYDNGFLQIRVDTPKRTRAADGTTAVAFPVTEGPVFRVGKLHVRNVDAATEKALLAAIKTRPGEVFSRKKIIADMDVIKTQTQNEVEPETELDPKKGIVDLTFAVKKL